MGSIGLYSSQSQILNLVRISRTGVRKTAEILCKQLLVTRQNIQLLNALMYQSIPSLTIPPRRDSHILVAPRVVFSLLRLARGSARGVLNQSKKFDNFEKKSQFLLCFLNN